MTNEKEMKIMCKWCNVSKTCHVVSQKITDHNGNYRIDSVMMAKVKIHKHFKGKNYCKGSDRTTTVPLDEMRKYNEKNKD
ncbi:hypothetical protein K0U27_09830 [archaeon]|nr:hypothetical protein [archaeon]